MPASEPDPDVRRGRGGIDNPHVHPVFVRDHRRRVCTDEPRTRRAQLIHDVCGGLGAELREFDGETDHLHLPVHHPPSPALSLFADRLNGVASRRLRQEYPGHVRQYLSGSHLWSPSSFAGPCGGAALSIVEDYIEQQKRPGCRPATRTAKTGIGSSRPRRTRLPPKKAPVNYLIDNFDKVLGLTRTHLYLALVPLFVGLVIAVPVGIAVRRVRWLRRITLTLASVAFTIPSLALFVTIPSVVGLQILDPLNVVIALTIYAAALLVRAVPEALDAVPADVIDSATAMGFTSLRRALTVELPLALPVLFANIRVVAVTNISLVSVGSVIGIGGLGQLFTQGYQRDYPDEILAGIIAIVVLALVFDALLYLLGRALTPWTRTGDTRATNIEAVAEA